MLVFISAEIHLNWVLGRRLDLDSAFLYNLTNTFTSLRFDSTECLDLRPLWRRWSKHLVMKVDQSQVPTQISRLSNLGQDNISIFKNECKDFDTSYVYHWNHAIVRSQCLRIWGNRKIIKTQVLIHVFKYASLHLLISTLLIYFNDWGCSKLVFFFKF